VNAVARVVRAYPAMLRAGFAEAVAYRAEMLVWMLTMSMPLVSLALWSAVADAGPVGRFDQRGFTTYFLATLVVRQLTSAWVVWEMNMEVRTGTLSRRLLKPIHPLIAYSAQNLAALPLRAAVCAPVAALAILLTDANRLPAGAAELSLFALSLLGAWLINFLTMAIVGSLAFFMESSTAVFEVWLVAFMLLSGYLVPLELFPEGLREIVRFLPFRYMVAYPVELVSGLMDRGRALQELGVQWAFVVLCGLGALAAWRAGVRRFGAYGG
jgi:ABC-2 type transport system permease protein